MCRVLGLGVPMLVRYFLLLPLTLVVGWSGTQTALHIRRTKDSLWEGGFMLILCWSPLVICLLALLLSLYGSNP
ncbi:MAG: hypothetical protein ACHQX0_08360 [Desulfobaccales bacterium]